MRHDTLHNLHHADAHDDWKKARRKVIYKDIVCLVKGCSVDLLSFSTVQKKNRLVKHLYLGLQNVPLGKIKGSVGRFKDFNSAFMPRNDNLEDRWKNVEVAMLEGKTPPIELYKVGEDYFVVDGNHRVSVARLKGFEIIEAYVTNFRNIDESAQEDTQTQIIAIEKSDFLKKIGRSNAKLGRSIQFTSAGCYQKINKQVEMYRFGYEQKGRVNYTYERAFKDWHEEIYGPALKVIKQNDLLNRFPDRTEADLYIWSAENSDEITNIVMEQERIS